MTRPTTLLAAYASQAHDAALDYSCALALPLCRVSVLLSDDLPHAIARGLVVPGWDAGPAPGILMIVGPTGETAQRAGRLLDGPPLDLSPSLLPGVVDVVVFAGGEVFVSGICGIRRCAAHPHLTLVRGGRS